MAPPALDDIASLQVISHGFSPEITGTNHGRFQMHKVLDWIRQGGQAFVLSGIEYEVAKRGQDTLRLLHSQTQAFPKPVRMSIVDGSLHVQSFLPDFGEWPINLFYRLDAHEFDGEGHELRIVDSADRYVIKHAISSSGLQTLLASRLLTGEVHKLYLERLAAMSGAEFGSYELNGDRLRQYFLTAGCKSFDVEVRKRHAMYPQRECDVRVGLPEGLDAEAFLRALGAARHHALVVEGRLVVQQSVYEARCIAAITGAIRRDG